MTINSHNFEAYLLDYLEGNLDPLLTADLMAFLAENPEFEKYLPDYDSSLSLSDTHEYTEKNKLKRDFADLPEITTDNFDEFCIASCEGLLDDKNIKRLSDFISRHPGKQHDLDLYRKAKLEPDAGLHYDGKELLKKNPARVPLRYLYYAMGLAASVALLFLLVFRKPAETSFPQALPVSSVQSGKHVPVIESLPAASQNKKKFTAAPVRESPREVIATLPAAPAANLAPLRSITAVTLASSVNPPGIRDQLQASLRNTREIPSRSSSSDSFSHTYLGSLLGRINIWKTAEKAITGFNYLTESQLSVEKTTDESGKLTGLLIQMESYDITGNKIK